jgi:hypothetical protein
MNTATDCMAGTIGGAKRAGRWLAHVVRWVVSAVQARFDRCVDEAIARVEFTARARQQAERILGPEHDLIDRPAAEPLLDPSRPQDKR